MFNLTMTTVNKIRDEFAEKFTEHIVSVDHNVVDKYDSEFSFHVVCHPRVDDDGQAQVPEEILDFVEKISSDMEVRMHEMHIHLHVKVSDKALGINEETPLQKPSKDTE